MINRQTILDLAEQAADEHNVPLRCLLLTVAGMLDPGGKVVDLPDSKAPWREVASERGAMGRGLLLLYGQIQETSS